MDRRNGAARSCSRRLVVLIQAGKHLQRQAVVASALDRVVVYHTEPAMVQSPEAIVASGAGDIGLAPLTTAGLHGGSTSRHLDQCSQSEVRPWVV